jgi:hypothetical protein
MYSNLPRDRTLAAPIGAPEGDDHLKYINASMPESLESAPLCPHVFTIQTGSIRMTDTTTIRLGEERDDLFRRAMEASDENTRSGMIDRALLHYIHDRENKKRVAGELTDELADDLSTPALKIERTSELVDS